MFTTDYITHITKEQFSKLSPENRKWILKILSEFKENNRSETLEDIWKADYEEIPVSIDKFIEDPYYLGTSTRNGESIYPYWRKKYREIFDPALNYEEVVLTGAIGVGKTKTSVVCLAYLLYRLMCLRNPQKYFKFNEGDKITIFFLNISLKLAEGVGFNTLHDYLLNSPWFMARGTKTGRIKERYNPPKNISITFGSKAEHALGQQIYCAFMDEIDFTRGAIKGSNALDAQNGIMQAYTAIKERINSRFIKNGIQYGRLFLVSSKKSEHDFLESYVKKMKEEGHADKMLIVDEPQWVIKPEGTFSKKTFPVAVGNRSLKSRMLKDDISEEEKAAIIKQGYEILYVPENFRQSFSIDINTALMNLAGRSVFGATSFFNYDLFSPCYIKDYKNPFVTNVITIGIKDELTIEQFFELDKIPIAVRYMPQFIHIDGSLTGDRTGITSVGVSGMKQSKQYNGADEYVSQEMTYKHIFTIGVKAPEGSEISFEKTRQFIYYLRAHQFNIIGISIDGFQSADMRQILTAQGYKTDIISLDRSPDGYLALRSAMNDGRIGLIQIDELEVELVQLQRDVRTGKLDHPPEGCFTGDTKIRLVDGRTLTIDELMIEQTYKDNYVYTVNEQQKKIEPKRIKKVFQTRLASDLLRITLDNGESIECTPNHRFMLRDGSYLPAENLVVGQSLMPLYTDICSKGLVGYRMFYDPFSENWHFEHRSFCTNIKSSKGVVHHRNYNKLDNSPSNLIKVSTKEHRIIHNNSTLDYSKVSSSVHDWHERMRGTEEYELRSQRCRDAVYRKLTESDENYVPRNIERESRIRAIEDMFGVTWSELSDSEKDSYGVKYSRAMNPDIQKRISEKIKQNHALGKYENAIKAISNRHWYTDGINNVYIKDTDPIPEGYRKGRVVSAESIKKRKPLSEKSKEEQDRIKYAHGNAARNKKWINNGIDETYIPKDNPLPEGYTYGRLKRGYRNHKIVSIELIHKPCRVYDIEVEDNHNFALDAGVFVHNSKDLSDSLAGALFNASINKQGLIDNMQLFDAMLDVNEEIDPRQEMMNDMQQSMMASSGLNSYTAANKIEELLSGYSDPNIICW